MDPKHWAGTATADLDAAMPRSANLPWPRSLLGPTWGTRPAAPLPLVRCRAPLQCWSTVRHSGDPKTGIGSRRSRDRLAVEAHRGIALFRHASPQGDVLATWHRWQKSKWRSPSKHAPPPRRLTTLVVVGGLEEFV